MTLPFTPRQFFDVISAYNRGVWPAQVLWFALALACVWVLVTKRVAHRGLGAALAALWAWMGIAYHLVFFTRINPAAWVFGGAFLGAAALFAKHAWRGTLRFEARRDASAAVAAVLVAYALVGYPALGFWLGHHYPYAPTFGLPCPTTIFTLGLLLLAKRPAPSSLFVVPFVWALIGTVAAFKLGVTQDYGLFAAVFATAVTLSLRGSSRREARA